ncbi:hypothetical protein ACVXZ4_04175 [Lacisediminihabitans sp. FW035]
MLNSIKIQLDPQKTKRADWGRLYTDADALAEALEIAARGNSQDEIHDLWGIHHTLTDASNKFVDVDLVREYAEELLGRPVEISVAA